MAAAYDGGEPSPNAPVCDCSEDMSANGDEGKSNESSFKRHGVRLEVSSQSHSRTIPMVY